MPPQLGDTKKKDSGWLSPKSLCFKLPETGLEPALGFTPTRPSTWRLSISPTGQPEGRFAKTLGKKPVYTDTLGIHIVGTGELRGQCWRNFGGRMTRQKAQTRRFTLVRVSRFPPDGISPDYAQPWSGKMLGRVQTPGPRALAGMLDVEAVGAVCAARTARCVRGLDLPHGARRKPLPPIPRGTGRRGDLASPRTDAPLRLTSAAPRPPAAGGKAECQGPHRGLVGGWPPGWPGGGIRGRARRRCCRPGSGRRGCRGRRRAGPRCSARCCP